MREDNDDNESLDHCLAKLGSTAETKTDGMNRLLQDIASHLDISKWTGSPVTEGIAKIFISLLKNKINKEKTQTRIEKHPCPKILEELRTPRVNMESVASKCSHPSF